MKRLHINLAVGDLDQSVRFYSALFAAEPAVIKHDYAKWMLEDPRVNFAITTRGERKGIDHLGIQAENPDELRDVYGRLKNAGRPLLEQGETTCCYARSEKTWVHDPDGVAWETFLTTGESPVYGEDVDTASLAAPGACCSPSPAAAKPVPSACC
ncbi:ArsI/CadI family heavy metal resistance metalloenzyme [Iodidimonas sp. SYSU 1G8]|uniref:ArsI/CadI family heavy metal resistance metalloenzyme n=1 Tax=Iodidimonas sp. SYSU 1G8 TaxID=3133967 RepID=UPI0031FEF16D